MIKKHKYVANDFSDDATIWKYFSLPAFLAMLEDRMLYFSRADCLSDPNEFPITEKDANAFNMTIEEYKASIERIKAQTYINCWRISNHESFGMWNAYADAATGVAIRTDIKTLFSTTCTPLDITAGKIIYIDNIVEMTQKLGQPLNTYYIAFAKTKPYENENELRLTYEKNGCEKKTEYEGIPVDTISLIKEVRVGSSSKPYVQNLIKNTLMHYGINVPVNKSIVK